MKVNFLKKSGREETPETDRQQEARAMGMIQSSIVFRPPKPALYTEYSLSGDLRFRTTSRGSTIPILIHLPHPRRREYSDDIWILFSHGNAEDLGVVGSWASFICEVLRRPVLCYDYTGYGLSNMAHLNYSKDDAFEDIDPTALTNTNDLNIPSEENIYADIEAVVQVAVKELGFKIEDGVFWGRSLGCAPSCFMATKYKAASQKITGVILQSPFTSVYEVAANFHFDAPLSGDMFRNYDLLKSSGGFDAPCFVIHGQQDWIVNWWHGQEMAAIIPERYRWPPLFNLCGHNNVEEDVDRYMQEITEFIEFCKLVREVDSDERHWY